MQRETTSIEPMPFRFAARQIRPTAEFADVEPDYLRDAIRAALSSLPFEQRKNVRDRLLTELTNAGLRVRESLLMLGVSARTTDELTAPEIAALIRYVRLTKPNLMTAVAEPLGELLDAGNHNIRAAGKAA